MITGKETHESDRCISNRSRSSNDVSTKFKAILMDGKTRKNITIGSLVNIVLKQHQRTGTLTKGVVKDILTKSPTHPHGIKVRLESGAVGRVKEIVDTQS